MDWIWLDLRLSEIIDVLFFFSFFSFFLSFFLFCFVLYRMDEQIPFLSLGAQFDHRKEIYRDQSPSTGEYVIEEVEEDDDAGRKTLLRRLIFLSNPSVIQSEARLSKGIPQCLRRHQFGLVDCCSTPTYKIGSTQINQINQGASYLTLNCNLRHTNDQYWTGCCCCCCCCC